MNVTTLNFAARGLMDWDELLATFRERIEDSNYPQIIEFLNGGAQEAPSERFLDIRNNESVLNSISLLAPSISFIVARDCAGNVTGIIDSEMLANMGRLLDRRGLQLPLQTVVERHPPIMPSFAKMYEVLDALTIEGRSCVVLQRGGGRISILSARSVLSLASDQLPPQLVTCDGPHQLPPPSVTAQREY